MDRQRKPEGMSPEAEQKIAPEVSHVERSEDELPVVEKLPEVERGESSAEKQEKTAEIVRGLADQFPAEVQREKVEEYITKNLPANLREVNAVRAFAVPLMATVGEVLFQLEGRKVEGRENIPRKGAALLVANHTRESDPFTLAALAKRPLDFAAADMHFQINPALSWFFKKIGLFEVKSSLGNLNEQEKSELMTRLPKSPKYVAKYYEGVLNRSLELSDVRTFIRETAALLARGDAVVFLPEGLWLFEGSVMRQAYPGIELVNNEYKRLTGESAPIVPIAISDKKITVAKSMMLGEGDSVHTVMQVIADLLPEAERGYYGQQKKEGE